MTLLPEWTDPFMATALLSHVALGLHPGSTTTWLSSGKSHPLSDPQELSF